MTMSRLHFTMISLACAWSSAFSAQAAENAEAISAHPPTPAVATETGGDNRTSTSTDPLLEQHFQTPPAAARPWVYWMWLDIATTPECITRDLEEMRAKGIAGVILYNSGVGGSGIMYTDKKLVLQDKQYRTVPTTEYAGARKEKLSLPPLPAWTPRWRELIRFAAAEAGRLGIEFCLNVGLASTSGPIDAEYGQQQLLWSETAANGPSTFAGSLPASNRPAPSGKPLRPGTFTGTDIAVLAVPDQAEFPATAVIDLTGKTDSAGQLRWEVPAGKWKILRFAYAPTGAKNVWGLFTDGMSAEAMDKTWESTIGPLLKESSPAERKGLTAIEDDSWEARETTWTKLFPAEFQQLRGYALMPRLPALIGLNVGGPTAAAGVRRDFKRTIADLIAKNHYGRLHELAQANHVQLYAEAAGPNSDQLDGLLNMSQVDFGMGEVWVASPHRISPRRRFMMRTAASGNHLYGKRITPCESFTSVGPFWEETFFALKNTADQAFAEGLNRVIIHNWSHSPSLTAKPGYAYFAGTFYSRTVTWWEQTPAFNAYLGRCSHLLQQGLFVADALYYYRGDAIGQVEQMKTRPGLPAEGCDHDNCNSDVLLNRVSVENGRIVLPDGMSYRILVLPTREAGPSESLKAGDAHKPTPNPNSKEEPLTLPALEKVAALVQAGATVVGPRPTRMAGLATAADAQARFEALVAALWDGGKISDKDPAEVLKALHVGPDFAYDGLSEAGDLDWIHRATRDVDIYFVASRWPTSEKVTCTFRVTGKRPELWNPVTGEIRPARAFTQHAGCTIVPLEFNPCESVFVVFRESIPVEASGTAASNYPSVTATREVAGPWEVAFDPHWGGPEKITFAALTDWTKRSEDGIRHYSGTAEYRKQIQITELPAAGEKLLLDLGEVREIASVTCNGQNVGVVWTRPAQVDITAAVRKGANEVSITVVNLWPNRLIGDADLPPEKRFTETNFRKFTRATPLYPSGLLGPVTLRTAQFK